MTIIGHNKPISIYYITYRHTDNLVDFNQVFKNDIPITYIFYWYSDIV